MNENSEAQSCQLYAKVRGKEGSAVAVSARSLLLGRNDRQGLPVSIFWHLLNFIEVKDG